MQTLIPTQLNIAPRGKTWKGWQLVDGEDGFKTREAMKKYHCNPERVQSLEEERLINLETIDRLNVHITKLEAQLAAAQQGVHPENIREGAPYDNPEFEQLARDMGVWGTAQSAVCAQFWLAATHPTQQGLDAVRELIALHSKELEKNPYAYFELAHTRQTGWCAWITDHPRSMPPMPIVNPDRKVLASGQGDTPDAACAAAIAAQAKQGGV